MRSIVASVASIGIALTIAGCDPVSEKYFREGAGKDLYSGDGARQTELQNQYIEYVCNQAGLGSGDGACVPSSWALFVQAGMNDIDQRCDAYLTWLDAVRRDREPVLAELSAIGAATHSIMTVSGAGPAALDIVTAAFGLASATYSNWNSRLLLAVNQSTVQTIVYSRQQQYRATINTYTVSDRAYAIYLLRNYLRICMPITIETDINTSTTLVQRGAPMAARDIPVVETVRRAPLTAVQPVAKPVRVIPEAKPAYAALFADYSPEQYRPSYVKRIQAALCVPPSEQGDVGTFTINLVAIYQQASREPLGKLDDRDITQILSPHPPSVPCSSTGAKNYYERITYTDANQVSALIKRLNKSPAGGQLPDNATLADARNKIRAVRVALSENLTLKLPDTLADQMTRDLDIALFNLH